LFRLRGKDRTRWKARKENAGSQIIIDGPEEPTTVAVTRDSLSETFAGSGKRPGPEGFRGVSISGLPAVEPEFPLPENKFRRENALTGSSFA
jgi:hypothetical protein